MLQHSNHCQNHNVLKIAIMPIEVGSQYSTHAEDYLSAEETTQFKQFNYPKRQQEWFTARLVSKLLVLNHEDKQLLGETSFACTPSVKQYKFSDIEKVSPQRFQTVEILKAKTVFRGKPEVYLKGTLAPYMHLSISHAGGWAAACISSFGVVGIDIEEYTPRSSTFYDNFFSPWEKIWVQRNVEADFTIDKLYTLLWTLKESYYKTGVSPFRGLFDLSGLEVRPLSSLGRVFINLQSSNSSLPMRELKLEFSDINLISPPRSSFLMMPNCILSVVAFGLDLREFA